MRNHIICLLLIAIFCSSCGKKNLGVFPCETYKVNLEDKMDPFKDIFSKAEIIPLETVDSGLVVYCNEIYPADGRWYIYDDWTQKLFAFNQLGKFEFQIGRKGQGPGEYLDMYDCIVDSAHNTVLILESYGKVLQFDLLGKYKRTNNLPDRPNYYSIELLDSDCFITWSALEANEKSLLVIDKENGNILNSYWNDDRMFNLRQMSPFFSYDGRMFFGMAVRQQVYEVLKDELKLAYVWDFGKDNITESQLEYYLGIENSGERNNKMIDDIGTSQLPFIIKNQRQNERYCYAALRLSIGIRPTLTHVFYDKENDRALVFDYLDGKECRMNSPLFFGDDYLLTDVLYDDRETFKSILPEEEYRKLENMLEDDNPCLLKLYFKK